jgi:hypothetical protein
MYEMQKSATQNKDIIIIAGRRACYHDTFSYRDKKKLEGVVKVAISHLTSPPR